MGATNIFATHLLTTENVLHFQSDGEGSNDFITGGVSTCFHICSAQNGPLFVQYILVILNFECLKCLMIPAVQEVCLFHLAERLGMVCDAFHFVVEGMFFGCC